MDSYAPCIGESVYALRQPYFTRCPLLLFFNLSIDMADEANVDSLYFRLFNFSAKLKQEVYLYVKVLPIGKCFLLLRLYSEA